MGYIDVKAGQAFTLAGSAPFPEGLIVAGYISITLAGSAPFPNMNSVVEFLNRYSDISLEYVR